LWTEILCAILTLRSSVFRDITRHVLLVSYRHFGTTYRSHLQGSSYTMVVRITILNCVKSQKNHRSDFIVDYILPAKSVLFLLGNQHCGK